MTIGGFAEPLLIAVMRLKLSHWNNTGCLAKSRPHTTQLSTTGTRSLAIISLGAQVPGHCHCNHRWLKTAPQPQDPGASVWMVS